MSRKGRKYLKDLFRQGALPTESNFALLIDSLFNLEDDEINNFITGPLNLSAAIDGDESDRPILEFSDKLESSSDKKLWTFSIENESLILSSARKKRILTISQDGEIFMDATEFKVNGTIAAEGVKGEYSTKDAMEESVIGTITANGQWQDLILNVEPSQMFSVVAGVGEKGTEYALAHAIATLVPRSTRFWDFIPYFTPRNARISVIQSHSRSLSGKIDFRWAKQSDLHYSLKVRTRTSYGANTSIRCHITKLWFNDQQPQYNIPDALDTKKEGKIDLKSIGRTRNTAKRLERQAQKLQKGRI